MQILIVEDEEQLRRAFRRGLTRAGHTVFEAGDTTKADQVLQQETNIQVILLDTNLPGEDGPVWYFRNQSKLTDAGIRVIAMSGAWNDGNDRAAERYDQTGIPRLSKPFGTTELLALLQS